MPIYEYRCAECGFQDEYLQKVSEPPLSVCPSCGKAALRKLVSAAGFQLKGSGWYVTDFRGGAKGAEGAKAAEGTKGDPKAESKGEAKPEAKGEAKDSAKAEAKTDSAGGAKAEKASAGTAN